MAVVEVVVLVVMVEVAGEGCDCCLGGVDGVGCIVDNSGCGCVDGEGQGGDIDGGG